LSTARDYRAAVERGPDLAEPESPGFDRSPASGPERRLTQLPDGHPSAARYVDGRNRPEEVRPLTDAEHAEHIKEVEAKLDEARAAGLATHKVHTTDRANTLWSRERRMMHDEIVEYAYEAAAVVPCEGKALIAGGLAGSGKTTVLTDHAGIGRADFFVINPDEIKEEMARRGLIPEIYGLSPMEASDLVHEESSHIARRIAHRAQADRRNVVWDITMSKGASAHDRVADLRAAGYSRVEGIFVDIPIETSLERAEARHRLGHDQYLAGDGLGGRYVPADLIKAQSDETWGSLNRRNFESVKDGFDAWSRYDNAVDGRPAVLVEASERGPTTGR
jgi:hypothetical protein